MNGLGDRGCSSFGSVYVQGCIPRVEEEKGSVTAYHSHADLKYEGESLFDLSLKELIPLIISLKADIKQFKELCDKADSPEQRYALNAARIEDKIILKMAKKIFDQKCGTVLQGESFSHIFSKEGKNSLQEALMATIAKPRSLEGLRQKLLSEYLSQGYLNNNFENHYAQPADVSWGYGDPYANLEYQDPQSYVDLREHYSSEEDARDQDASYEEEASSGYPTSSRHPENSGRDEINHLNEDRRSRYSEKPHSKEIS